MLSQRLLFAGHFLGQLKKKVQSAKGSKFNEKEVEKKELEKKEGRMQCFAFLHRMSGTINKQNKESLEKNNCNSKGVWIFLFF